MSLPIPSLFLQLLFQSHSRLADFTALHVEAAEEQIQYTLFPHMKKVDENRNTQCSLCNIRRIHDNIEALWICSMYIIFKYISHKLATVLDVV